MATNRKPEQAKEVGAVGVLFRNVHVTDEQFVQARPKDKHDSSDEIHIWVDTSNAQWLGITFCMSIDGISNPPSHACSDDAKFVQ